MKSWMGVLFLLVWSSVSAQNLAGTWKGKIAAFNLTVVFNITEQGGKYSATMDSPDQGAKGIPCDEVSVSGNHLVISSSVVGGNFVGTVSADGKTISGKWNQGGGSFDLVLGNDFIPAAKEKPQTPQPPFPYNIEEVEYDNADKTVHLAGTITTPKTGSNFPAVILVSGSGQQDRDETILGHKPFAVIADRLTRLGFAVLRVDDRGMGKSTGPLAKATSADFAEDVLTGISFLKARTEIDRDRIGLIGHSEGGLIASIVSSKSSDVKFMILLAGPGIKGAELLSEQSEAVLLKSGVPADAVKAYMPFYNQVLGFSAAGMDSATLATRTREAFHAWKATASNELVTQVGFTDMRSSESILDNLISGFSLPWMQFFLASDAGELLEHTTAKVLALNGEKDIQVLPASNTAGIRRALEKSRSAKWEVKTLPGLNHLFQQCNTCSVPEYGTLDESFSETALQEISNWLRINVLQ